MKLLVGSLISGSVGLAYYLVDLYTDFSSIASPARWPTWPGLWGIIFSSFFIQSRSQEYLTLVIGGVVQFLFYALAVFIIGSIYRAVRPSPPPRDP